MSTDHLTFWHDAPPNGQMAKLCPSIGQTTSILMHGHSGGKLIRGEMIVEGYLSRI